MEARDALLRGGSIAAKARSIFGNSRSIHVSRITPRKRLLDTAARNPLPLCRDSFDVVISSAVAQRPTGAVRGHWRKGCPVNASESIRLSEMLPQKATVQATASDASEVGPLRGSGTPHLLCFTLAKSAVFGLETAAIATGVLLTLLQTKINPAVLVLGGAVIGVLSLQ